MRKALCRRLGVVDSGVDEDVDPEDRPEGSNAVDEGAAAELLEAVVEETAAPLLPVLCLVCERRFSTDEELREHVRGGSVSCIAREWQAVVHAMACLPGAGTSLWCPACADDFVGKWTGPATKAGALLRHLSAASKSQRDNEPHLRLSRALVELLFLDPPPDTEDESLQEWAGSSRLFAAAGPLLAKPSLAARMAINKLENEILGLDASAASKNGLGTSASAARESLGATDQGDDSDGAAEEPKAAGPEKKLRILGLDLTVEGAGLYDDDVPIEGGVAPDATDASVDALSMGCQLPAGGAAALRFMDLTMSSDEEAQAPVTSPTPLPASAPTDAPGRVAKVSAAPAAETFV